MTRKHGEAKYRFKHWTWITIIGCEREWTRMTAIINATSEEWGHNVNEKVQEKWERGWREKVIKTVGNKNSSVINGHKKIMKGRNCVMLTLNCTLLLGKILIFWPITCISIFWHENKITPMTMESIF